MELRNKNGILSIGISLLANINSETVCLTPDTPSQILRSAHLLFAMVDLFKSLGALEQGGLVVVTDMSLAVVRLAMNDNL